MKKHADRVSKIDFTESSTGEMFIGKDFATDLSHIKVLMSSVDTVRQLYRCTLEPEWLQKFEDGIVIHESTVQRF